MKEPRRVYNPTTNKWPIKDSENQHDSEVGCSELLAENNQRKILEVYDLLEQWARRVATCDNMLRLGHTESGVERIKTKRGMINSMKLEVQRILNQDFS